MRQRQTTHVLRQGSLGALARPLLDVGRLYTLDMIADDIKGLFDALGIERSHWIGLSMGGVFGLATALKYRA